MVEMKFKLIADSNEILELIFEKELLQIKNGEIKYLDNRNAKIELNNYSPHESFGLQEVIVFVMTIVSSASAAILANYISSKIIKTDDHIVIFVNNTKVEVENLEQVIKEISEKEGNSNQFKEDDKIDGDDAE